MRIAAQHLPSFESKRTSEERLSLSSGMVAPGVTRVWKDQPQGGFTVLKFANCELWVEKRELVVAGVVQRVQPRVFELVLYLIERFDRVVSRDELLRHVWKTAFVSDSVIGRCIMKARRVLRDTDPDAPIIRTLPRAGYRFASPVIQARPTLRKHFEDGHKATQTMTVATLPFLNLTGRQELIWIEFGLAALLNHVLEAWNELSVAPIMETVTALNGHTHDPSSPRSTELVTRVVATRAVIAVQVSSTDEGFALSYQLHRESQLFDSGQIAGSDLTRLTSDLGRRMSDRLVSSDAPRPRRPSMPDTFTNEAFARAMQATNEQRFQVALDYLEVCVVSDSHPVEMDVEYIASLAAVDHPETESKARCVLADAKTSEDALVQARVLRSLSTYHRAQGNEALARNLIRSAFDLTRRQEDDPLTAAVLLERSEMAIVDRELNLALSLEKRVLAAAQNGDRERLVPHCLRLEGVIAHLRGDVQQALDSLHRSERLSRIPHVQNANLASTLHRVAIIHRDAGRLKDAVTAIDEAEHCARSSGMPARLALVLAFQATLHSYAGNRAEADTAHDKLKALAVRQSRSAQFLARVTSAWLSWRDGNVTVALEHMAPARGTARDLRNYWLSFGIGMHAGMAIAGAQYALARELIAEMEANRGFYDGTCLQGLSEYFAAALAHRQGDRMEAWRLLRQSIRVSSVGIVRSNACLAAAWLACEDRTLQDVQGWLDEVPSWTREHPNGIIALARYRYEAGDWAGAVIHQARYVETWPGDEVTLEQRSLLAAYREAAIIEKATAISRLPCLLTLRS